MPQFPLYHSIFLMLYKQNHADSKNQLENGFCNSFQKSLLSLNNFSASCMDLNLVTVTVSPFQVRIKKGAQILIFSTGEWFTQGL